ncbi:MAG: methionine--tRNA ligase, partial [Candidatus Aenigmarchaeota archaeon]|nr:methionine--tRNA ligase [Candidatus Aenigmarchaeota archaeon]
FYQIFSRVIEIKRVLVTSALPYIHGMPHLGNIIGSVLPADVYHRYLKLAGYETIYICGSDSHGTMFEVTAEKLGTTPEELVFKNHEKIQEIFKKFNINFTYYGITHSEENKEITYHIFKKLDENGYLIEEEMELPYCKNCKRFLADRWIEGRCPYCGGLARGDQCDDCGRVLTPKELINPRCVHCGKSDIEFRKTKHLLLDLPRFESWLRGWIESSNWSPLVKNFSLGWLKEGLKPRTITRDASWGFPVPKKGYEGKVLYVWFDAPIGYIGITKEWSNKIGKPEEWKRWWLSDDVKYVQFMGKDNVPFHTITFPSSLKGTGENWKLVDDIVASAWLLSKGVKFSKSRGEGLTTEEALKIKPADYWRYVLISLYPETDDSIFTWEEFQRRINNELSDVIGNFVHRVLSFTKSNFGEVPSLGELNDEDKRMIEKWKEIHNEITDYMENARIREALKGIVHLCKEANAYFNNQEPWHLIKQDEERVKTILNISCNIVRGVAILLDPFLPDSSKKILEFLNEGDDVDWKSASELKLSNHPINKPKVLFEKIIDEELEEIKSRFTRSGSDPISFLDLRVAKILEVKDHPNADRLYVLKIDCGEERQIVAGLKMWYSKSDLLNKKIIVVANLEPAVLRGEKSNGMLLAAEKGDDVGLLYVDESEPGDRVFPEGIRPKPKKVIPFKEFQRINKLVTGENCVLYEDKKLVTESGEVVKVDRIGEGAKIG